MGIDCLGRENEQETDDGKDVLLLHGDIRAPYYA